MSTNTYHARHRAAEDFIARYRNLNPGMVLDVSSMNFETFTGVKIMKRPLRTGKISNPGVNIISSNQDNYNRALNLINQAPADNN